MKKWQQDLTHDIRSFTEHDDQDHPDGGLYCTWDEVTYCNYYGVDNKFHEMKGNAKAILEIGISRNGDRSITQAFLKAKLDSTIYVGIDIDDKTYLDNKEKNVFTIRNSSSDYEKNVELIKSFGVEKFDFIFIDGWHSINQVLDDWEYINLLADGGVVGLHDINHHPGPKDFIAALDTNKWVVDKRCPDDWGVAFVWKK